MPNKDKTGPEGKGPMTGRGLGNCNKRMIRGIGLRNNNKGFRRFGFRQAGYENDIELDKDQQIKILEENKKEIKKELEDIEKKLKELQDA